MVSSQHLAFLVPLALFVNTAAADTFVVTNTSPGTDPGSLRWALLSAKDHEGLDHVHFNIPGPGVHTIVSIYPDRFGVPGDDTVLDGYTQPGSSPNTAKLGQPSNAVINIRISPGSDACEMDIWNYYPGLEVGGDRCVVRGIEIDGGFCNNVIVNGEDNVIEGCRVGGASSGIWLLSAVRARIGGTTAASRNCIVGSYYGILVSGSNPFPAIDNVIRGNYVGLNPDLQAGPNAFGIYVANHAYGTQIGGHITIPCTIPAAANFIDHNSQRGIVVVGNEVTGTTILSNQIFSNGGIGIDIGNDGVTANDNLDADAGPNMLQNRPQILHAYGSTVYGKLSSAPNRTYMVQVFDNSSCDNSGNGEGKLVFGETEVTTGENGVAGFAVTCGTIVSSRYYTATATDSDGNTSEFSNCFSPATATSASPTPQSFALHENMPNPFNPSTTIPFEMGSAGHIDISIYGLDGKHVRTLLSGTRSPGVGSVVWDGRDDSGRGVSSGVYFCRMRADNYAATRKLVLLK